VAIRRSEATGGMNMQAVTLSREFLWGDPKHRSSFRALRSLRSFCPILHRSGLQRGEGRVRGSRISRISRFMNSTPLRAFPRQFILEMTRFFIASGRSLEYKKSSLINYLLTLVVMSLEYVRVRHGITAA